MKNSERILDPELSKVYARPIYKPDPDCTVCHGEGLQHGVRCEALNCTGHTILCVCREANWDVEKQEWKERE